MPCFQPVNEERKIKLMKACHNNYFLTVSDGIGIYKQTANFAVRLHKPYYSFP